MPAPTKVVLSAYRGLIVLALALMLMAGWGRTTGQVLENNSHFSYFPLVVKPFPRIDDIHEPLLIDGEEGRLYAQATVAGVQKTVVLATEDGHYLDSYPFTGRLALDRSHHHLLIDQGDEGLVILDSLTGEHLGIIELPVSGAPSADPQIDPHNGVAYAFRGNTVYMLDIEEMSVADFRTLSVPLEVCGTPQGEATISRSFFDLISSTIYVAFNTWVCTPHSVDTIYIYDAPTWHEWSTYDTPSQYQAVPYSANLYGLSYISYLSTHAYWALNQNGSWYEESGGGDIVALSGSVVDWSRDLLYEALWAYLPGGNIDKRIRISSTATRQALATVSYDVPPIQDARLVGHDPHTDQLYFLEHGLLYVVSTSSILPVE